MLYSQLRQERELRAGRFVDQTKGLSEGATADESDGPPELDASY
jgi:hypothetical protein